MVNSTSTGRSVKHQVKPRCNCSSRVRQTSQCLFGEKFLYIFKAALRAARAGAFAGGPRLAAALPARPGGRHRETGGHDEAPAYSLWRRPGLGQWRGSRLS